MSTEQVIIDKKYLEERYPADVLKAAMEWIDGLSAPTGIVGTWRVQRVMQTVRLDKDQKPVKTPVRIVRFAKGCPWALMHAAKDYLLSEAPYTGYIANGLDTGGKEIYKPVRTLWERDDGDSQMRQGIENQNRHTLTQELLDITVSDSDGVKLSENCTEETTAEYFWDMPGPPDNSEINSSVGVTMSVQGLNRQQDGTYNYMIVTRKTLAMVGDEITVDCTAFEKKTVQRMSGLRKSGDNYVDENGFIVNVPSPRCGNPESGEPEVQINAQQAEDCTWVLTIERTYANEGTVLQEQSAEVLTEKTYSKRTSAVKKPEKHIIPPDPVRGVTYKLDTQKRPDGRFEQTLTENTEKECPEHQVQKRRTLQGTTVTTVNLNMPTAAQLPDATVYTVGNTRTPSGRFNQEVTVSTPDELETRDECQKTIFRHTDSKSETISGAAKPSTEANTPGNGRTFQKSVRLTELGSYEVTDVVTTENYVKDAQVTKAVDLDAITSQTTDSSSRDDSTDIPDTAVGSSVSVKKTDGGLVDRTVVTSTLVSRKAGETETATIFERQSSTTQFTGDSNLEVNQVSAGDGVIKKIDTGLSRNGNCQKTETTTTELTVPEAEVSKQMTRRGLVTSKTTRNSKAGSPSTPDRVGESVSTRKTPGGLTDITEVSVAEAAGKIDVQATKDKFRTQVSKVENQMTEVQVDPPTFAKGFVRVKGCSLTDAGTYDVSETLTTAHAHREAYDWVDGKTHHYCVRYRNQPMSQVNTVDMSEASSSSVDEHVNEFGLYDGVITWTIGGGGGDGGGNSSSTHHSPHELTFIWCQRYYPPKNTRQVKTFSVNMSWKHGHDYTSYIEDTLNANVNRTTYGILATRLIGKPWADSEGTLKAEWVVVNLTGSIENSPWEKYDPKKHRMYGEYSGPDAVRALLEGIGRG